MNITDLIKQFSILYKKEVLKPHSKELMSYKLLVNQLPLKISEITSFVSEDFILKGSKWFTANYDEFSQVLILVKEQYEKFLNRSEVLRIENSNKFCSS